jgi:DNA topoisomerase I
MRRELGRAAAVPLASIMPVSVQSLSLVPCKEAAEAAGLTYASAAGPGFTRRRAGKGFCYRGLDGKTITDPTTLKRIRALAIPPAWTSVWICPDPDGHLQAAGYDARGRRQYRYHPMFRELREGVKFEHMIAFAESLSRLREIVDADMSAPGLGRKKVIATVVRLLETTMIRVGNEEYARENKSYGLTTLLERHVKIDKNELRFQFKGKSGKEWQLNIRDRRIAKIIRSCQELPGQQLFQYLDEKGERQTVTSADVNAYLRDASGVDITAKDFRTWAGTVLAAAALCGVEEAGSVTAAKRNLKKVSEHVASRLGNTPAICRKCYIHPEITTAYLDGCFGLPLPNGHREIICATSEKLRPEELAVLAFLKERKARALEQNGGTLQPSKASANAPASLLASFQKSASIEGRPL